MGIGKAHTPIAFVQACESFTYSEILADQIKADSNDGGNTSNPTISAGNVRSIDYHQVDRAFRIAVNIDNGQAKLSRLADELRKLDPSFDHRKYGYPSFSKFCSALSHYYEMFLDHDGTTMLIKERTNSEREGHNSSAKASKSNETLQSLGQQLDSGRKNSTKREQNETPKKVSKVTRKSKNETATAVKKRGRKPKEGIISG